MKSLRRANGMTLIELLVALLLLSLLSTGVVTAFRIGHRSYAQVVRIDRAEWSNAVAQRFVRQVLESAYPFEPEPGTHSYGLEGSSDHLLVSAPSTQGMGATGMERYEFGTVTRGDGLLDLRVRAGPDRNGRAGEQGDAGFTETLVERVASVEWMYFGSGEAGEWLTEWADRRGLPILVRLRVAFPQGDSRRWPDLVVSTRITDDANCEFDFVRQDCREPGQ
jgi:general secretion pathway protein J